MRGRRRGSKLRFKSVPTPSTGREPSKSGRLADLSWYHRLAGVMPDLILQGDQGRRRQRRRRFGPLDAVGDQARDVDFAIRVIGIPAAVPSEHRRANAGYLEQRIDHCGRPQIPHQQIPFGIDVGTDMMRHLPGIATEADPTVIGYRAEPDRTAIRALLEHQPQANMVPSISALVRNVTGSAGNQAAACIAKRMSSRLPTSPTLSASPGIPVPVRVTIGSEASPG